MGTHSLLSIVLYLICEKVAMIRIDVALSHGSSDSSDSSERNPLIAGLAASCFFLFGSFCTEL